MDIKTVIVKLLQASLHVHIRPEVLALGCVLRKLFMAGDDEKRLTGPSPSNRKLLRVQGTTRRESPYPERRHCFDSDTNSGSTPRPCQEPYHYLEERGERRKKSAASSDNKTAAA